MRRIARKRAAIEPADHLDHRLGLIVPVGHYQRGQRIERVEQEMRIDLVAQRFQLRRLGRAAIFAFAPFGDAGLHRLSQRDVDRTPRQQQVIAAQRDVGQLLPEQFLRTRRGDHGLRRGLLFWNGGRIRHGGGVRHFAVWRHGRNRRFGRGGNVGYIDQQVARLVPADRDALFVTDPFRSPFLDFGKGLLVDEGKEERGRCRRDDGDHDTQAQSAPVEPAQEQPQENRDGNARNADDDPARQHFHLHVETQDDTARRRQREVDGPQDDHRNQNGRQPYGRMGVRFGPSVFVMFHKHRVTRRARHAPEGRTRPRRGESAVCRTFTTLSGTG